jgi:quercetin dioxygenase-like cupin family protein
MRALFLSLLIPFLAAQTATEVEVTAEPSHHLVVENEYIRAFQVEVAPQTATLMHRHRHDYIYVTIGDAHISNEVEGKPPVDLKLADGETRFAPGNFAHVARNLSDQPFRNVTIELMQDEKLRQTPSHWPEESGETTFPGGRNKILFVKDGVRVSEVNLEPGAVAPSHHYDGPHLLVAITDLDVRSDVEGMGPMPGKFKPGDVKWLPGGYTHTPHLNECRPEPGKISDGGILESSCGDGKFVWGRKVRVGRAPSPVQAERSSAAAGGHSNLFSARRSRPTGSPEKPTRHGAA